MDQVNLQGHGQQKMRQATAAPRKYDGQQGNPLYDSANGGHYGTSTRCRAASRAHAVQLAARPVAFTMDTCADLIPQAHQQLYVLSRIRAYAQLPVADIWSRLPHKIKLPIRSSSPAPGKM